MIEMTETIQTLLANLNHPDRDVRSGAAISLGKMGDSQALNPLLEALYTEENLFVREDITWALVRMRELSLLPLMDLLRHANPAARFNAAHTLSKISDSRAVDALILTISDDDSTVAAKAVFALGQIGDIRAIPALIGLLGHDNHDVQSTLSDVLERFGDSAVQPLIHALKSERCPVREQAADILGIIGSREAVPALIEVLQDQQWQVRFSAVTALGSIGGAEARQALQQMQNDSDQRVRNLAPNVMKRIKGWAE